MSKYVREVNSCLIDLKNGNIEQFDRLYALTANHLKGVVRVYLRNKSFCDDVMADTYIKVIKYVATFDENLDGYNWLCKIVQNVSYNYNQKEFKRDEDRDKCEDSDYVEKWENVDALMDVEIFLNSLSDVEKRIFTLKYDMEYSFRAIARILGCSKSEVNRKHKLILKKLEEFRK